MWEVVKQYVCQVHVGFEVSFKLVCPCPSPQPQHHQSIRNKQQARIQSFSSQILICLANCEDEQLACLFIQCFLASVCFCFYVGLFVVGFYYISYICSLLKYISVKQHCPSPHQSVQCVCVCVCVCVFHLSLIKISEPTRPP